MIESGPIFSAEASNPQRCGRAATLGNSIGLQTPTYGVTPDAITAKNASAAGFPSTTSTGEETSGATNGRRPMGLTSPAGLSGAISEFDMCLYP